MMMIINSQPVSTEPILRDYQLRDADRIRYSYQTGHRAPLYVAPCGSGKTILFSYICRAAVQKGNRVLIACHRVELVDQISAALYSFGIDHSFIASGYSYRPDSQVYVASVFTLVRRLDLFYPDLIIVDEAHHVAPTWAASLKHYSKARRLGVTATPYNHMGLDSLYDDLVMGPTYQELTDAGYLTPLTLYAPQLIDTTGLHIRRGEYIQSEVVGRADLPRITGDVIECYKTNCPGKRAVVFDVSVDAARRRATGFREAGFSSECIDGQISREVRTMAVTNFRTGRVQVLTTCNIVSEGFDLPAIEVGIVLRPTQSLVWWRQSSARILRPMEGKSMALLFDHARNWETHGLPTEDRPWDISGDVTGAERAKSQLSPRICSKCLAVSPGSARVCKACKVPFPVESRYVPEDKEGRLAEITAEEIERKRQVRQRKAHQASAITKSDLMEIYFQRHGHDDLDKAARWAQHVLDGRKIKGRGRYG